MNFTFSIDSIAKKTNVGLLQEHVIDCIRGYLPGPTLVIMAGIHGNEPAGVHAAKHVLPDLLALKGKLRGEVVLLQGNTRALEKKVRYIDVDLNRQWSEVAFPHEESQRKVSEFREREELFNTLREVVARRRGEIYFLDLHTTSANGEPFATVGDTLRNRTFALQFPVRIVLGLEEQIEGTLLEFMNNRGAITLGFEAGQHDALSSVENHEAVIWNAVVAAGNLMPGQVPELDTFRTVLKNASGGSRVIEVRYRYPIRPEDHFRMEPGFNSFQPVKRGELLATDKAGQIKCKENGLIVMPLYQRLGDDGFFVAREVKRFWLRLSGLLRRMRLGNYLHHLPGVHRDRDNRDVLVINTRVASIFPLQILHLLGFRKLRWVDKKLVVSRRAFDLEGPTKFDLNSVLRPPGATDDMDPSDLPIN